MDNQRIILFMALAIVVLFMWESWEERTNPQRPQQVVQAQQNIPPSLPGDTSIAVPVNGNDVPGVVSTGDRPQIFSQSTIKSDKRIRVQTDVFDIDLDTVGGDLRRAFLSQYPISLEEKDKAFPLMDDNLPQLFIAQSGLLSSTTAPDHHASYAVEKSEYTMAENQTEMRVPLTWQSEDGNVSVTKTYIFKKGDYLIDVELKITNNGSEPWRGRIYRQLQRTQYDEPGKSRLLYTFSGAAVSSPENHYEKITFEDMKDWRAEQSYSSDVWAGMIQHYFVSAWVPNKDELNHLYTRVVNDTRFIVGLTAEEIEVSPGTTKALSTRLYIGPKDQNVLEGISENLNLTVDYGVLTFIAQPLFWLLSTIHGFIGNWGWSIIFVTLIIKLLFYKLSEASYRSMANMRKIAPKFQAIRERYGDDRQRMSQAMMELYKKEKVNPMSGCWPMLVQIPVFIALYWVLLESVELRQAPFILWIEDLSAKDPFYILPLLMGASMFLQQKLSHNPAMDPMHQKIMQFLPIVFTLFFMLFPAGLVLYWVVNSVLSILQQWYIMRKIDGVSQ